MLLQFSLLLLDMLLLQQQFGLPLQGLLVINNLLLHLMNGLGIAMRGKEAVKIGEVFACGFAMHTQISITEVVIGGGLQLVCSHTEEPATYHDQSTD